jgi:DeoR family transcriptional regulator, fructose operon transcriptional repressor
MLAEERQRRIEGYLQQAEFASLDELARHLDVSTSTIRRDLTVLEGAGNVRRTHGGARLVAPKSDEFAFASRDSHELAEKEAIGRLCASLIQARQTVILDAGTTVFHAARHLEPLTLQVITNSLPVANLFGSHQRIEVVVSGGVIYPRLGVLVGPMAVETFRKTHADVAIMSAGGISADGVTNSHALLVDIQRAMMEAAGRVVLCMDHTKLGRRSVAQLCGLSAIDVVITDARAAAAEVDALRTAGIEVLVAPLEGLPEPAAPESPASPPPLEPQPAPEPSASRMAEPVNVASWD